MLPRGASRAETLWYLAANYGVWAAGMPFWDLPPDVGGDFLRLCQQLHPMAWTYAQQIAEVCGER